MLQKMLQKTKHIRIGTPLWKKQKNKKREKSTVFRSLDHLAVGSFAVMAANNMADIDFVENGNPLETSYIWASNWGTSYCCPLSRSIGRRVVWTPLMLLAALTMMGNNFQNEDDKDDSTPVPFTRWLLTHSPRRPTDLRWEVQFAVNCKLVRYCNTWSEVSLESVTVMCFSQ